MGRACNVGNAAMSDEQKRPGQYRSGRTIRVWKASIGQYVEMDPENMLANADIQVPYGDGSHQFHFHPEAKADIDPADNVKPIDYVLRFMNGLRNWSFLIPATETAQRDGVKQVLELLENTVHQLGNKAPLTQGDTQRMANSIVYLAKTVHSYKTQLPNNEYIGIVSARMPHKMNQLLKALIPDLDPKTDVTSIARRAEAHYTMIKPAARTP